MCHGACCCQRHTYSARTRALSIFRYNDVVPVSSWQPADLLALIAREPLANMRKGVGASPFLIVRLDDFSNDLELGLAAADEAANRRRLNRSIKSTLQISVGMTDGVRVINTQDLSQARAHPERPGGTRGFPAPEWLNARCYVVRLSNRAETGEPLSIGRDTNLKIVLQHPSVSAAHAQLIVSPELSLLDTKSRNGTFIKRRPGKRLRAAANRRPDQVRRRPDGVMRRRRPLASRALTAPFGRACKL